LSRQGGRQHTASLRQFSVTAPQGVALARSAQQGVFTRPFHLINTDRLAFPLHADGLERCQVKDFTGLILHLLTDQDLTWGGRAHQPGGKVDLITHHSIFTPIGRAHQAGECLTLGQANPVLHQRAILQIRGQMTGKLTQPALVEQIKFGIHGQCRPDGPLGIVFMGDRSPKQRQEFGAGAVWVNACDGPPLPGNGTMHGFKIIAHDGGDSGCPIASPAFQQRLKPDIITEHHHGGPVLAGNAALLGMSQQLLGHLGWHVGLQGLNLADGSFHLGDNHLRTGTPGDSASSPAAVGADLKIIQLFPGFDRQ